MPHAQAPRERRQSLGLEEASTVLIVKQGYLPNQLYQGHLQCLVTLAHTSIHKERTRLST